MVLREITTDNCRVLLYHPVLLNLLADHAGGDVVLSNQEQATGVTVKAGNQVRPLVRRLVIDQVTNYPV